MFEKGQLPAVDIGKSISRVGGKAQLPAFRYVAGDLRLSYAQFEELETFARVGTRLDEETRRNLDRRRRVREILKQDERYLPSVPEQIIVLLSVTNGLLDSVPLGKISDVEHALRKAIQDAHPELHDRISSEADLTETDRDEILEMARRVIEPLHGRDLSDETLEALGKFITTTKELRAIVDMMKSLSAVSIRQYEQAAIAPQDYARTIELGLIIVLREENAPAIDIKISSRPTIAIVFGSDHGLCGWFDYDVVDFARKGMQRHRIPKDQTLYLVAGARAVAQLEAGNEAVEGYIFFPGAVGGLTETAHNLLLKIDRWRVQRNAFRAFLFYNFRSGQVKGSPHSIPHLPIDTKWTRYLAQRRWTSRTIPTFIMAPGILFAALVRQHFFISLFRTGAESAAGEHARRLAAMQAAESHIDDRLDELNAAFRRKRQGSNTEELLDVIAGFEALSGIPERYL